LSAGKDVLGGWGGGIADLAKGGMSGLGGLLGGAKDLWQGSKPIRTAASAFGDAKSGWDILHGKIPTPGPGERTLGAADGAAKGLGALNSLLGFGHVNKPANEKDGLDHALDTTNSILGGAKSVLGLPGKLSGMESSFLKMTDGLGAGKLPGGQMMEKL